MEKKYSLLYVDDEESNLHIFKNTFRREYNVFTAISALEGLEILDKNNIDLILTDQRMPEMNGVDFLKKALIKYPDLNRILVTAYTDFEAIRDAVNEAKIFQYIQKPWSEESLKKVIEQGIEVYRLKNENLNLTQQLNAKNEQLEKINTDLLEFEKSKSEFLSFISHEIRTPLNGLVGPLDLLKEELVTKAGLRDINNLLMILQTSANRLEHFSILALRITELKAKKYRLKAEDMDINHSLKKVMTQLDDEIYGKKILISSDIQKQFFYADPFLLETSLNELYSNAIKYSNEADEIQIKTYPKESFGIIEIIDKAGGFSAEYMTNFNSQRSIKQKSKNGLGINLDLLKRIMDMHEGKIEIQNNPESKGATVRLYFKNKPTVD